MAIEKSEKSEKVKTGGSLLTGPYYLITSREFMTTLIGEEVAMTLYPGCSCVLSADQFNQFSTIPMGSFSYNEISEDEFKKYSTKQGVLGFKLDDK